MKDIKLFISDKYDNKAYHLLEEGIYAFDSRFVMSLSFVQEPEFGEGAFADAISQYPLDDLLERFFVYVSDFYKELNKPGSKICFLEFCSPKIERLEKLKSIIGKHIYNKQIEVDGELCEELVIE